MGKHEFLTPKAIANRIKAKGLQRLRWYCEMCQKQCRDANGFKCHCESESHQRQMLIFAERPKDFMDRFSREFEASFMDLVSRRWKTKRVAANVVYNEYIADRQHTHMNATIWSTLTEFVQYLGKTGKCHVEETDKGWYIKYIDRDPEALARAERTAKKEKMDLDDEDRAQRFIEQQKLALQAQLDEANDEIAKDNELQRQEGDSKIVFQLNPTASSPTSASSSSSSSSSSPSSTSAATTLTSSTAMAPKKKPKAPIIPLFGDDDESTSTPTSTTTTVVTTDEANAGGSSGAAGVGSKRFRPDSLPQPPASKKAKTASSTPSASKSSSSSKTLDFWLAPGIVVKVLNKRVGDGQFYKQNGVVQRVIDKYVAQVRMIKSGAVLQVDQEQLQTVVPSVGEQVLIVNGKYRSQAGLVEAKNDKDFSVDVRLLSSTTNDLVTVDYDHVSQLDGENGSNPS